MTGGQRSPEPLIVLDPVSLRSQSMPAAALVWALDALAAELGRGRVPLPSWLTSARDLAERRRAMSGQEGSSLVLAVPAADGAPVGPLVLTVPEAGAVLRVSETTVKRLIRSGELRSVKVAGGRRVRLRDLEEFVASLDDAEEAS